MLEKHYLPYKESNAKMHAFLKKKIIKIDFFSLGTSVLEIYLTLHCKYKSQYL